MRSNTSHRGQRRTSLLPGIAAGFAGFLAACGGGGGDGGGASVVVPQGARSVAASAGSDVRADNMATLGGWLARAVLSASGNGAFSIASTRENAQALGAGAAAASRARAAAPLHAGVLRAAAQQAATQLAARELAAAVRTEVETCANGGSLSITVNDADDNNKLSTGDSVTAVFTNCVLDSGIPAVGGTLQLTVNAVELRGDEVTALDASTTVTGFSIVGYGSYTGSMRLWNKLETGGSTRSRVSYRATNVIYASSSLVFDFDIYSLGDASTNFDLNGGLGVGGQTFALLAGDVFAAVGSNPPGTGSQRLVDGAGDTIRLTARSASTFDLEFIPSGGNTATATSTGLRWADYLAPPQ